MGRHSISVRSRLTAGLVSACLSAATLVGFTIGGSLPASAAACPAGISITPVHSSKFYWDKKGNDNITGAYLGYKVTNTSGADLSSVSVGTSLGSTGNAALLRGGSQPASETIGTLTNGTSAFVYFLVNVKQSTGTDSVTTTLNYNSTNCTLAETLSSAPRRALAANANKLYTVEVLADISGTTSTAPSAVKHGSYATVVVTGNTGTIGAGPDANREINLTPVVYPGNFSADAWQLVDVQFYSNNSGCGSSGLISNQLHISTNTTITSANCGGLYSAAYTFKSRTTDKSSTSEVQAFSYIASGNLIKHTSPYGSVIGLPTVNNATGTATGKANVSLSSKLSAAIAANLIGFTADDTNVTVYQSQTITSNALTSVGGTQPISAVCLVDPNNSNTCSDGPFTVKNLKSDETFGTTDAGVFRLVTVNGAKRVQFTANNSYFQGGANSTDLPARIVMRLSDSASPASTSDAFANALILQGTPPTATGGSQAGPVNQNLSFTISATGTSVTKCLYLEDPMPEPCTSQSVTEINGSTWTLSGSTVTYVPANNFAGTKTIKLGVTDSYGATASADLTATTTSSPIYTLSFNANFGAASGTSGSVPANITGNGSVSFPQNTGNLEKPGFAFGGWSATQGGTTPVASPYTLSSNTTFYAIWNAAFTITFNGNGSNGGAVPSPVVGSGNLNLPGNSGALTNGSQVFMGWSLTQGGTSPISNPYNLTSNVTLYAIWQSIFTLTYDGNGHGSGSAPANQTGNGNLSISGNTGSLAKSGFTFGGWLIGGTTYNSGDTYNLTADTTATAIWTAVVQSITPTADPCAPVTSATFTGAYVELGLVGVVSESLDWLSVESSRVIGKLFSAALKVPAISAIAVNQASTNLVYANGYGELLANDSILNALGKASPATNSDPLEPSDVSVEPGSDPNSLEVNSNNGDPLELLDVTSIDLDLYVKFTGAELNNPALWQDLGYGAKCWKLEPFSDTWFYLPDPIQPPGAPAGNWVYSNIIVKAGSITADPTTFQTNTWFTSPRPGQMVWADVNGDGIYNPGGKTGDKAISHIVICANLAGSIPTPTTSTPVPTQTVNPTTSSSPTPTASITPTVSPTPTATPTYTVSPTPTPTIQESPEPTQSPCSSPTVAPPSPTPSPVISILLSPTPTPSSSTSPSPSSSPTPTVTVSPTTSPSPTSSATPSPTPTPSDSASPSPSASPTPSDSPSTSPSPSVTPTPGATPPAPDFDPNPPTICSPNDEYDVAMKLSNGKSTLCYRVTSESLMEIAAFGGLTLADGAVVATNDEELAATGFTGFHWLFVSMLLMSLGAFSVLYARRRD